MSPKKINHCFARKIRPQPSPRFVIVDSSQSRGLRLSTPAANLSFPLLHRNPNPISLSSATRSLDAICRPTMEAVPRENGCRGETEWKGKKHRDKHDKDKPRDDTSIDHWKIEKFDPSWNKGDVGSSSTLLPQYREEGIGV